MNTSNCMYNILSFFYKEKGELGVSWALFSLIITRKKTMLYQLHVHVILWTVGYICFLQIYAHFGKFIISSIDINHKKSKVNVVKSYNSGITVLNLQVPAFKCLVVIQILFAHGFIQVTTTCRNYFKFTLFWTCWILIVHWQWI